MEAVPGMYAMRTLTPPRIPLDSESPSVNLELYDGKNQRQIN